jgi:hypothetical protein
MTQVSGAMMHSAESRRLVSGAETVTARPLIISNFHCTRGDCDNGRPVEDFSLAEQTHCSFR